MQAEVERAMAQRWGSSVGAGGIALYAGALVAGFILYPHFWTSSRMGDAVPWYFIGRGFIDGACALAALVLVLILGAVASSRWGRTVWGSLIPAAIFLSWPIGQGMNVLLHTSRIWSQGQATTQWTNFNEYMWSNGIAAVVSLTVVSILIARGRHLWKSGAA
jgi:hypothetical protein